MKNLLVRFLFHLLDFNQMKEITVTREEREAFDSLFHGECLCAEGNSMNDSLTYPKYKFLQYIVEHKNVLIHGTSNRNIKRFEPRRQSLFNGEMVCAVFAASDGIWPMFFAIINREQYKGSLRNMCLSVPTKKGIRRYYYFSLSDSFQGNPFHEGTVYILPKEGFKQGGIRDEWICEREVKPLARLNIGPDDFPFLHEIRTHRETDSIYQTLIKSLLFRRGKHFVEKK